MDRLLDTIPKADILGIFVQAFPNTETFFQSVLESVRTPHQTIVGHLNIHGANIAHQEARYREFLQQADFLFCDGMGIVWGSRLLPTHPIPTRFTAADFLPHLLRFLFAHEHTVYFLGWQPDVVSTGVERLKQTIPNHRIVGYHHGYIHQNDSLQQQAIEDINRCEPDVLFVGFGMPLQEYWIQDHREQLRVRTLFPLGATLDYLSGHVSRTPAWMGRIGMEWLWRFALEPRRLFRRYVTGNPAFFGRILQENYRRWKHR